MAFGFKKTISFLYIIIIVLLISFIASLSSHNEECLALYQFKQTFLHQSYASFNVGGSHKFASWRKIPSNASGYDVSHSYCCSWDGIVCSNEGQVIGLNLGDSSLRGPIKSNSTLFNLVHLRMLNLSMNDFVDSQIPSKIARLKQLRILDLSECGFSGQIPSEISQLTQLTKLDLSENELTGVVPSLGSLLELNRLDLSYNNFEKGKLFNGLSKLTNLRELYVEYTNIYEEIPTSIANLTKLSAASMGGNFIFGQIPSSFMNLTKLTFIDLSFNQLQGPISSAFSTFESLVYLNLVSNKFNGTVDLDTFVGLKKLEFLDLGGNRISVVSTNYTNGTLQELKWLGLSSCNLKGFPPFLYFQKKMKALSLYDNKIGGLIPTWVWNNSKETLLAIDLSNNFITGFHQHTYYLPWINLEVFQLGYNKLQGRVPIPPQTMIFYDVSNNNLIGEIPPSICEAKSLQYLDFSSNQMIGTLPWCFGNLSNSLSVLNLKGNDFHGPMLNSFTQGCPLKRIDLSENRFTGQVSKSLANCVNLEVLSLEENSFDGLFPLWLGGLEELQVLILRSNKFYGELQGLSTISSQLLKLRILDISNNNFSGELPDMSFPSLNEMKSVYSGISTIMAIAVSFDISITNVVFTPSVYLYTMTLTTKGVKREYETTLNVLIAIDLSCNNFVGEIPQSLHYLQGLQFLNLSNNHLTGRILSSLGNLSNLESLDLSRNKLSGEIPPELVQLGYLAIFNVSFNQLDGHIPRGKQFNTFDRNSYIGNSELCGQPLSDDCERSKVPTPRPTRSRYESLLPSERIDWIIVLLGVGSGLIVGIVVGNILWVKYSDWFMERFGLRKDKWVRPLRNKRRS